ncbi:UDP-2,3-diacylglucosamine diphosphatase LpxI [Asticcacaulis sp. BYS171W]|uniref:UDP-2,3-diacylglucosamine diphosphatase LpxI n=1 Tax=Asticcacaulis aquaticus TaxID=2984212 RepID=A0ABT5HP67_9CAUL|nr:UDP-2,3-diacylglucosamine diphosphatase LpxI [Asticcacaulis aquaticus]MDC7681851.1 UDP-2,3-diacylglucosamine diphosphatase LpxI [Asticcacaulis aquaticus]
MSKLALIAGGGWVPVEIARYLKASGRDYCVIRLAGLVDEELNGHPGHDIDIGHFQQIFVALAQEGCKAVCMVGYVKRPDFDTLKRDEGGAAHLPSIQQAGRGGDDSLLRQVAKVFESQGYVIEGAHEANPQLLLDEGLQAGAAPSAEALADVHEAFRIAHAIGALDIGQAVVVADRITLAVEAQEGTDALLKRIPTLSPVLIGREGARKGVLAKVAKPIQDLRLDMPTIGVQTVEAAAAAGLAGIVGQAGALLVVDKARTYARAAELGLFIYGHAP